MRLASHLVDPEQTLASVTTKRTMIDARRREDIRVAILTFFFIVD